MAARPLPDAHAAILKILRDWRYATNTDAGALAGVSRPRASVIVDSLVEAGRLTRLGNLHHPGLRGCWLRPAGRLGRFVRAAILTTSSGGESVPLHAAWVTRIASVLGRRLPEWETVSETQLRRDWGWFYGRMSPGRTSRRVSWVPDFLLYRRSTGAGVRVEIQLARKSPAHFRRLQAVCRDDFPIWLICPAGHRESLASSAGCCDRITVVDPYGDLPPLPSGRLERFDDAGRTPRPTVSSD